MILKYISLIFIIFIVFFIIYIFRKKHYEKSLSSSLTLLCTYTIPAHDSLRLRNDKNVKYVLQKEENDDLFMYPISYRKKQNDQYDYVLLHDDHLSFEVNDDDDIEYIEIINDLSPISRILLCYNNKY